ncbi:FG-GAP-like repeat-containing protein [Actinocorallia sp. B10E7]|uniref:VCBS repeat-containing protein n=1 Tax=Actinocorallia sp. B10E7 TaxID=3153558 RepID=UPI00325EAF5E
MKISSLAFTGAALAALAVLPTGTASAKAPAKPHDFNGDGRTDLVINGPESVKRGEIEPGVIAILYGKTHRKQTITRDTKAVAAVAEHGDRFGEATASADFDRDGYADLAITGPEEDGVTIVYGSKKGLSNRVSFLETSRTDSSPSGSLAVGDLDGDGYADLVATVETRYWIFSKVDKGKKQPGTTSTLTEGYWFTPLVADFTGDGRADLVLGSTGGGQSFLLRNSPAGLTAPVPISGLNYMWKVAVGDLNGDRRTDLVTSTWGRVQIRLGGPSGFGKPKTLTGQTPGIPLSGARNTFGFSLAIGDVNRDGKADLAIGARDAGAKRSGQVILLYGHKKGLTTKHAQVFSQKNKGLKATPESNDHFGGAVRLIDMTGDRRPELVIGSPGENKNTGRVYVLANKKGRITTTGAKRYQPRDFGFGGFRFGSLLQP